MMHRVDVHIIDGREEVPLRTHEPVGGAMANLPSARAFLTVQSVAGASVISAHLMQQFENVGGFNEEGDSDWATRTRQPSWRRAPEKAPAK